MATLILQKRGLLSAISTLTAGQLYLATDTSDIYIGSASGNKLVGGIAALLAKVDKSGDTMTGQLISTLAVGTSPFAVTSTTKNTNLNADLLDGVEGASYQPILVKNSGTLTAGTETTVTDAGAKTTSVILIQPTSAAITLLGVYVSTKNNGSFVLTHSVASGVESFDYLIV